MSEDKRPKAPDHLSEEATLEWHRVCDELADADRLDKTDRALITIYAETWDVYRRCMDHVTKHGAIVKLSNGVTCASPFYKVSRETALQLRVMLTDLGLTPLARSKVKMPEPAPKDLQF